MRGHWDRQKFHYLSIKVYCEKNNYYSSNDNKTEILKSSEQSELRCTEQNAFNSRTPQALLADPLLIDTAVRDEIHDIEII